MFTGIVEEIGIIKSLHNKTITIEANKIFEDMHLGDSISVNGICLTVSSFKNKIFNANVTQETLNRTNLGNLKSGSKVNLERAISLNRRFGGHIVSGHIDGVGNIKSMERDDNAIILTIEVPKHLMKYIVEKGSVAVDGISLTVASLRDNTFSISVIPHTLKDTILYYKKENDKVNIENDVIGKYVERLITFRDDFCKDSKKEESNISMEFLLKNGF